MPADFSLHSTVRRRAPSLPFRALKKAALGDGYTLSLVFVGDARSRALNRQYRGKDRRANVLSFPLSRSEGEIFLNLNEAERDAPRFGLSYTLFTAKLFIHGMLHLKGYRHGGTMEVAEQALLNTLPSWRRPPR